MSICSHSHTYNLRSRKNENVYIPLKNERILEEEDAANMLLILQKYGMYQENVSVPTHTLVRTYPQSGMSYEEKEREEFKRIQRIIRQGLKDFHRTKCPKKIFWTTLQEAREGHYSYKVMTWMRNLPCISRMLEDEYYLPPQMRHSYNLRSCEY
jgi:hypothetical protein